MMSHPNRKRCSLLKFWEAVTPQNNNNTLRQRERTINKIKLPKRDVKLPKRPNKQLQSIHMPTSKKISTPSSRITTISPFGLFGGADLRKTPGRSEGVQSNENRARTSF
mmetsp:Transcript_32548/g.39993  ORF Transcript_32548/g.39993 Transcript_32548/m.39993 type:complete len:109 (+) Transcript_32548:615-941(+)